MYCKQQKAGQGLGMRPPLHEAGLTVHIEPPPPQSFKDLGMKLIEVPVLTFPSTLKLDTDSLIKELPQLCTQQGLLAFLLRRWSLHVKELAVYFIHSCS